MTEQRAIETNVSGESVDLEDQLRLTEARLNEAQRIAGIGSWEWDIRDNRDWWSDELYRILGMDPATSRPSIDAFLSRVHPVDRSRVRDGVEQAMGNGSSHAVDIRIVRPGGTERIVHSEGLATFDADGRPLRMSGTIQDVTELRRAENQIRRNEVRFRNAQRIANVGSWERDVARGEDWWSDQLYSILEEDPATCRPSLEAFLGKLDPDDRARLEIVRDTTWAECGTREFIELRILLPDDRQKTVNLQVEVLKDENDEPLIITGTVHDVTDRVALEREIIATTEHERSRIGYDLHDGLGQLLTGVSLGLEALTRKLRSAGAGEVETVQTLEKMVQESISESRRIARSLSPGFWSELGICEALRALASEVSLHDGISCQLECSDRSRSRFNEGMAHLYRIAQEAVNNSLRHSEGNAITIRYEHENDIATLVVLDDGIGIPPEDQRQEGLGLRSMRYRARMINGSLTVQARPEGGTEVRCSFRPAPVAS